MLHILSLPTSLLAELLTSALRVSAVAIVAAGALAALRVKATSTRLSVWTAVLYAALAIPLLGRILPIMPVTMPAFLAHETSQPVRARTSVRIENVAKQLEAAPIKTPSRPDHTSLLIGTGISQSIQAIPVSGPPQPKFFNAEHLTAIAVVLYFAVTLTLLVRFAVGVVLTRKLIRASRPILDARLAGISALGRLPVAESDRISVPVTAGVWRSTILLPVDWRAWDNAKLSAVLAHEGSHVVRRDALTQRLSLLHRAIFWFSPLAWWLDRHIANLAEQASDEAALTCGADRHDYARTLLGFIEALNAVPGRIRWQGVSMAKQGQTEERLERILAWKGSVTMKLRKSVAIAIVAFAVPVVYLAASARPASHSTSTAQVSQEPTPPPSAAMPAAPASPGVVPRPAETPDPASAPSAGPVEGIPAPAPAPTPVAAEAPLPPTPAWSAQSYGSGPSHSGYWYGYDSDDFQRFVIVTGKSDSLTMSGTSEDAHHAQQLRKKISGDFIWFERDEKSYIIRDQATIDRARKLWAPQEELGRKQEELGKKQEELGKQQEVLGNKMEEVRVQVPDMTAELDRLKAKLQKLGSSATMDQIGDLQSEIGELQSKLGDIQSRAGAEQGRFGEQQGELGRKQGELGRQQGELGRQQGELARKASIEMRGLLDEAIKNGKAQPEPENGGDASL
jgi:beta-lactamase regulating signal transducer with metallopeptidase domain